MTQCQMCFDETFPNNEEGVSATSPQKAPPLPGPMGGAPSACESVARKWDCRLRDSQTQARHESVSREGTSASRYVVPWGEGESFAASFEKLRMYLFDALRKFDQWAHAIPSPQGSVWTGDIVDGCAETWWTPAGKSWQRGRYAMACEKPY